MKKHSSIATFSQNEGIAHKKRSAIPTFWQKSGIASKKYLLMATFFIKKHHRNINSNGNINITSLGLVPVTFKTLNSI